MPVEQPEYTTRPQYNALNGEELRYLILKELDKKLGDYDEFRPHLTYNKFMYLVDVQVAVDAYPMSQTTKASAMAQGKSDGYVPDEGAKPKRFNFSFGTKEPVTKPDQVRAEAGIPVPKTTPTADGQIVDKLIEQKTPTPDYLKERQP